MSPAIVCKVNSARERQQGFAVISGIFLIVVLAALGAFMLTFSNTQQLTSAQDIQGTRAYWAARAGLEWGICNSSIVGPATITVGSPGVVTRAAHGFSDGAVILLSTSGALPNGLQTCRPYYVQNSTPNTFELADSSGTASIATTGTQSGVHTIRTKPCVASVTLPVENIEGFSVSTTVACNSYNESGRTLSIFRVTAVASMGTPGSIGYVERSVTATLEN